MGSINTPGHLFRFWLKEPSVVEMPRGPEARQNASIERCNRTVRYDWLAHYLFETVAAVQDYATKWLWSYNHERPNMALGGITLKQRLAIMA